MINRIINKLVKKSTVLNYNYVDYNLILKNKTAIIFGGTGGIGIAIANKFLKSGADVIIVGRDNKKIANEFDFECIDLQEDNLILQLEKITNKYDKIDIVVNCQGICPEEDFEQRFFDITMDDYDKVFKVNLKSVFFINQFFCKYFIEKKICGNILNIASTEGLKGSIVPYGISKSGVISLTKGIGKKMASDYITINGIAPGATATSMMKIENNDLYKNYIPSKRMSIPEEIANMAVFLVSDMGKNMNGEVIVIDGGESLH